MIGPSQCYMKFVFYYYSREEGRLRFIVPFFRRVAAHADSGSTWMGLRCSEPADLNIGLSWAAACGDMR